MYRKRSCSSSISSQLYETKLISLLYFRAIHDDSIEDFQIAANLDNIGRFDDIFMKFKVKGFDKPVAVFIHTRHTENKKQTLKIDLSTYFTSYLTIREHSDPYIKELFFKGPFDETESFFVFYTTARDEFNDDSNVTTGVCSILKDLIGTGGTAKQPYKQEEHVKCLCEAAMNEQMTSLAKLIAKFINEDVEVEVLLYNEIMLRYHVVLARQVFDVSEIQPHGYRLACFRHDFFDSYEEYLTIFKDTLFKEILKKRKIASTDIESLLSEFLTKPTDVVILSKLIEIVITYHNGFLEINKQYREYFRPELEQVFVSQQTVDKAIELAAREILLSSEFKLRVPAAFGNKDLMLRGSDGKKVKRLKHLTSKVIDLLDKSKASNIVTIDNSLDYGLLQLNGGLAGAIGNIFVLDDNTKLMKITDNCEHLGPNAKFLYTELSSKIYNLHEYKFDFKGNTFPKISFGFNYYEENLARDFLNRLLVYSNQALEKEVEIILNKEIVDYQRGQPNYLQVETDAIFLQFHEQIQKWFINPNVAPYLSRTFNLYQYAINNLIKDPLMSTINETFEKKLKQNNYTFTEDAVSFLNLAFHSSIIITENSEITALKVLQHFKNEDHAVLDFEHIANLPTNVCDLICTELLYMNEEKVLIIVYDTNSNHDLNKLEMILKAVRCKTTVVITNQTSFKIIQEYLPIKKVIQDKKLSLIDLSVESQMSLLENATVVFPGVEIKLDLLLKDWAETGSRFPCVTAPRARQQSDDEDASTSQGRTAAADDESGTGSRSTGEEEKILPGTSSDPVSTP